jgi:hypothetical protein
MGHWEMYNPADVPNAEYGRPTPFNYLSGSVDWEWGWA